MYNWIHSLPNGYFVLGDSGFGITPKLLTPLTISQIHSNPQTRHRFNYELSRACVRIEQVFGLLKRIFPYLAFARECGFLKHTDIVESLIILYNILIAIEAINASLILNAVSLYTQDAKTEQAIQNANDVHHQMSINGGYNFLKVSEFIKI